MIKPEIGDTVVLKLLDPNISDGMPSQGRVIAMFDSLSESWDPWGESAWAQSDADEHYGEQGDWYAMLETDDPADGTWSVGSYEVDRIIKN